MWNSLASVPGAPPAVSFGCLQPTSALLVGVRARSPHRRFGATPLFRPTRNTGPAGAPARLRATVPGLAHCGPAPPPLRPALRARRTARRRRHLCWCVSSPGRPRGFCRHGGAAAFLASRWGAALGGRAVRGVRCRRPAGAAGLPEGAARGHPRGRGDVMWCDVMRCGAGQLGAPRRARGGAAVPMSRLPRRAGVSGRWTPRDVSASGCRGPRGRRQGSFPGGLSGPPRGIRGCRWGHGADSGRARSVGEAEVPRGGEGPSDPRSGG